MSQSIENELYSNYPYNPLQITAAQFARVGEKHGTEFVFDTQPALEKYGEMSSAFQEQGLETQICYAVKSQNSPFLIRDMIRNGMEIEQSGGAKFGLEVSSNTEIMACIQAAQEVGFEAKDIASRMVLSNPNATKAETDAAIEAGVRNFVVDKPLQLLSIANKAKLMNISPEIEIIARLTPPEGAAYVSADKFGTSQTMCEDLLREAQTHGLKPKGLMMHMGWQTDTSDAMKTKLDDSIKRMASIFQNMKNDGISLTTLDLGGGWPSQFRGAPVPHIDEGAAITKELINKHFGKTTTKPQIMLEPGSYISASAGILKANILSVELIKGIEEKEEPFYRCIMDAGRLHGGLIDGHYPVTTMIDGKLTEIFTDKPEGATTIKVKLFGYSLDSADKVMEVYLTGDPRIRERFLKSTEATTPTSTDGTFAERIARTEEALPIPIVLHGAGAYTSVLAVGKAGDSGFNGLNNPPVTIISHGQVVSNSEQPSPRSPLEHAERFKETRVQRM